MAEDQFGVWCLEEDIFCAGTVGPLEWAVRELPRWVSGQAAAVDPAHFHYVLQRVDPAFSPWVRRRVMPGMAQQKCFKCNSRGSFIVSKSMAEAEDETEHYCECSYGVTLKAEDQRRMKGQKSARHPTAWARLTGDKDPFE
jgi:hypothetical protein